MIIPTIIVIYYIIVEDPGLNQSGLGVAKVQKLTKHNVQNSETTYIEGRGEMPLQPLLDPPLLYSK